MTVIVRGGIIVKKAVNLEGKGSNSGENYIIVKVDEDGNGLEYS